MEVKEHRGGALDYLVVEPDGYDADRPYPLAVLLHGYGSHMGDLAALCPEIDTGRLLYALPNAPVRLDLGYGSVGFAWVHPPEGDRPEAAQDAEDKRSAFLSEVTGRHQVEPGRIVVGGFSQGGVMAFRWGLPNPDTFMGLFALSARMPEPDSMLTRLPDERRQPIFISHGTLDPIIAVNEGRSSRLFLQSNGFDPEYHEYEMGHQITPAVLADLVKWLDGVLAG